MAQYTGKFTRRTNRPSAGNKWYTHTSYGGYSNCTTNLGTRAFKGATIYNCVGYCWGRYWEAQAQNGRPLGYSDPSTIRDVFEWRCNGDPPVAWNALKSDGFWRDYCKSYPVKGAIAFYKKNSNSKKGHVSFVEKVYSNGRVDFSNCNYSTKPLWSYQTNVNPNGSFGGYTLLGYLHPIVKFN